LKGRGVASKKMSTGAYYVYALKDPRGRSQTIQRATLRFDKALHAHQSLLHSLRCFQLPLLSRGQCIVQQRVKQATAGTIGGGEARITERHQLIDLGDNAALFGNGRQGTGMLFILA